MKVAILIVANDAEVVSFVDQAKASVVPKEIHQGIHRFSVAVKSGSSSECEIRSWLIDAFNKHEAVGIITENGVQPYFLLSRSALFQCSFSSVDAKPNMKNYFGRHLNRWLRNLIFLAKCFNDGKLLKCLLLPEQSFEAPELDAVFALCNSDIGASEFAKKLEGNLKMVRDRSIPKKKKSGTRHYLKDDHGRYFELAKERHGQSEVCTPPHHADCSLTSTARFGISIDRELHFNVSLDEDKISGDFVDCHNTQILVLEKSHINVFPNGYIR